MKRNIVAFATAITLLMSGGLNSQVRGVLPEDEPDAPDSYNKWCTHCHAPGMAGTNVLQERYQDALPAVLSERTDMQPAYIKAVVRGNPWLPGMSAFRPTEINDRELDAITAYLTRGN